MGQLFFNLQKNRQSRKRAFGLIEVLVSGVIIITVIAAAIVLRQRSSGQATAARHEATAYMLAQEGIEAVHQIRDTNFLSHTGNSGQGANVTALVFRDWWCGLTHEMGQTSGYASGAAGWIPFCNTNWAGNGRNDGNFSTLSGISSAYELGMGAFFGTSLKNENNNAGLSYPTWFTMANSQNPNLSATSLTDATNLMCSDLISGVEVVSVHEGTQPALNTVVGNAAKPLRPDVGINKEAVGTSDNTVTDNSRLSNGAASSCVTSNVGATFPTPISGYMDYYRQISIYPLSSNGSNSLTSGPANDARGNEPELWYNGPVDAELHHIMRVLVRVSWTENSLFNVSGSTNAVMLATYLSDWRPAH